MAKTRTTLTIDEQVLRAVKVRAARTGKGDSEVIEEALRRELGLDLLDRVWARNDGVPETRRFGWPSKPSTSRAAGAAEVRRFSIPTSSFRRCCRPVVRQLTSSAGGWAAVSS